MLVRSRARTTALVVALGAASFGGLAVTQAPADASTHLSHSANIESTDSHLFTTAELGFGGTGAGSSGVLRARSSAPGPWEGFNLDYVHDWDATAPANEVLLYSTAANNYVSAEFGWSGSDMGILHARSGSTTVGPWETFYITDNSDGSVSFSVYDGSTQYYVSAEEGWTGNSSGMLRARSTSVGPWEKFQISGRAISGYDDYPPAWKNTGRDAFANVWGYNRECVSFIAWKIYENSGGTQVPATTAPPSDWATYSINVDQDWGDAGNWAGYARSVGIPVNNTPTVGSVAEWNFGSDGGQFTVGHVALVTAVFPDGSIQLAQYNLREDGLFSTLYMPKGSGVYDTSNGHARFWVSWPDNFVHIKGF